MDLCKSITNLYITCSSAAETLSHVWYWTLRVDLTTDFRMNYIFYSHERTTASETEVDYNLPPRSLTSNLQSANKKKSTVYALKRNRETFSGP